MGQDQAYTVVNDTYERRMVRDSTFIAMRRPAIKGSFNIDITEVAKRIWALKDAGGANISLACYLMHAYTQTLVKFPEMNSMLSYNGKQYVFKDVDLMVPILTLKDRKLHLRHAIIRRANLLSLEELSNRLEEERKKPLKPMLLSQRLFLKLPFFLRKYAYKLWEGFPLQFKHQLGTSTFSYLRVPTKPVEGANMQLSSINIHTTSLTVSSFPLRRPKEGDKLSANASFSADHRLVDGMPLMEAGVYLERFVRECRNMPAVG